MDCLRNVRTWNEGVDVESDPIAQIRKGAGRPIFVGKAASATDVHVGKGARPGTVLTTPA